MSKLLENNIPIKIINDDIIFFNVIISLKNILSKILEIYLNTIYYMLHKINILEMYKMIYHPP